MSDLELRVTINGTDENPWSKMGLRQNPFPQLGIAEYDRAEAMVASLDGDPVKSEQDIRDRLKGFTEEFVQCCIDRYQPGERVQFTVTFPDRRS